jgi:hypothetical protein
MTESVLFEATSKTFHVTVDPEIIPFVDPGTKRKPARGRLPCIVAVSAFVLPTFLYTSLTATVSLANTFAFILMDNSKFAISKTANETTFVFNVSAGKDLYFIATEA